MSQTAQTLGSADKYLFRISPLHDEWLRRARAVLAQGLPSSCRGISLGLPEIDGRLSGHGLEPGLHEIATPDYRSIPSAWGFLLALVKIVAEKRRGLIFWPLLKSHAQNFGIPYGPGLKRFGLDPGRFVFARCHTPRDAMWAMEEALRLGGLAAVMGARERMDLTASRRVQLAAEGSGTPIFLLRAVRDESLSAARTRWRVAPAPSTRDRFDLIGHARWRIALERARGGGGGEWIMEWDHVAFSLRLSSELADRSVSHGEEKKSA